MKKTTKSKKLALSRETLRELATEASRLVQGGQTASDLCPQTQARASIIVGG